MSTATIRAALKTQLAAAVTTVNWAESLADSITPPAGAIERIEGPNRESLSGSFFRTKFDIVVAVAAIQNGGPLAKTAVDAFVEASGASSIRAALDGDRTIGGAAQVLIVGDMQDDDQIVAGGIEYSGIRVPVEVWST